MISDNVKKIPALRGLLNFLISVGLALLFLYLAFSDVKFGEVLELVSKASIPWVILFSAAIMVGHYIRVLRWKYILHSVKPDFKMWNLVGALIIGYGVNCVSTPPRMHLIKNLLSWGKYAKKSLVQMQLLWPLYPDA